jgi:hypothetical protein
MSAYKCEDPNCPTGVGEHEHYRGDGHTIVQFYKTHPALRELLERATRPGREIYFESSARGFMDWLSEQDEPDILAVTREIARGG